MNQKTFRHPIVYYALVLLFILTPFISACLFCLKDGHSISDIYIPLGGWSDEITYYKQIEGILSHGMPRGYFGYNQSKAMYGTLGVWGLIPLIPYVLWGFVCGWHYCAPIYANIFFCIVALAVFYVVVRPNQKCMGIISLFWVLNQFLNRHVLSGVIEASVIMQLTLVIVCGEYLLSDKIRHAKADTLSKSKDSFTLIFCTVLICILTLARPYFAVLFLIPLWKSLKDKRKVWIGTLPLLAIFIMVLFFINNYYFCSTYFSNIFSSAEIRSLGVTGLFGKIFDCCIEILRLIWYAMRYKGAGVGWYYLLLGIELLAMLCTCIYRKYHNQKAPAMFLITLIGNALILLSIIIMYDLGVGARHILSLIIVNAFLLIIENHFVWGGILAAICLFSMVQTQGADAIPYAESEYVTYMENLENEFSKLVDVTEEISYANVVAMPTADTDRQNLGQKISTYYGILFAMPAGVGISLDFEDFYDDPANIKAGYILVHPNGKIRQTLDSMGMYCIFETGDLALYSKSQ